METLTCDGHMGTHIELDLCPGCQVFWFDRLESLRLAPGATLRLFRVISERKQVPPGPLKQPLACPRCDLRLLVTHDRQRNTPFQYWRCARDHGRLITFFDFLREKDFIRPLTPPQLAELRAHVQMINCSNCGAPIDLVHASHCEHCGAAISMLDLKQIERTAAELQQADEQSKTVDPALPLRLALEKQHVEALFASLRASQTESGGPLGLLEMGLKLLAG